MAKEYISNIFNNDVSVGDVRQTLKYNLIKAYPSVNSSNGGNIHSEENVRWLSRQFTKKPFIIPYDDNETFKEFDYEGAALNAGMCTGGMANIDGYIFNMAEVIEKTSFNNTLDTALSTGSKYGYIQHHKLQKAVQQFMNGLQSSDLEDYGITGAEYVIALNNYKEKISNSYKYYIGEPYEGELMELGDEVVLYWELGTYGNVSITYTGTLFNYINTDEQLHQCIINPPEYVREVTEVKDDQDVTIGYQIAYNVYYGIIDNKMKPVKDSNGVYPPYVYVQDIFGFYYIWKSEEMYIGTHTYPSTQNTSLNFLDDTVTKYIVGNDQDAQALASVTNTTTLSLSNIYDMSSAYVNATLSESTTEFFEKVTEAENAGLLPSGVDIKVRDAEATLPTAVSLDTYFTANGSNLAFEIVNSSDIINKLSLYTGETATTDDFNNELFKLCDSYYCLPLNYLSADCKSFLCQQYPDSTYIPVGFLTSSGALMARNYEYSYKQNDTTITYIYIEGYVSFIRRVCAKLCGIDITMRHPIYGDMSDPNEYNHEGWNKFLKDFATGSNGAFPTVSTEDDYTKWKAIFGLSTNTEVNALKLQDVYNLFIAPYANFHLQMAWSAMYDFDLTEYSGETKYKTIYGYTAVAPYINTQRCTIVDDSHTSLSPEAAANTHVNVQVDVSYTSGGNTYDIPRVVTYAHNKYTDYNRLNSFLCDLDRRENSEGYPIPYYDKVNINNPELNKISLCEDYISHIKRCAARGYDETLNVNSNRVNIQYKVTNISRSSSQYGFNTLNFVVDRIVKYTNQKTVGDEDYANYEADTTNIIPIKAGYINNVAIRLDTLMPSEITDYGETFYCYPTSTTHGTSAEQINPTLLKKYILEFNAFKTIEYDGAQTFGLSGYNFIGNSQGWTTYIPTVFRLYKDGQNHLNGNIPGTDTHDGVYVDYVLPRDITEYDFWFTNTWLTPVTKIVQWDIEHTGTYYPKNTDGMTEYLHKRNYTILSMKQIYTLNEQGEFIDSTKYLENKIDDILKQANSYTDTLVIYPTFTFSEAVPTPRNDESNTTDLLYTNVTIIGLDEGIKELQNQINYITSTYEANTPQVTTINYPTAHQIPLITLENDKYFDIKGVPYSELMLTFNHDFTNDTNYYKDGINTQTSKVFKYTLRFTIQDTCKIYLSNSPYKIYENKDTINNYIKINWNSNYPIINSSYRLQPATVIDGISYGDTDDYIIIDNLSPDYTTDLLLDITITYNTHPAYVLDVGFCEAYCNISTINDATQLTSDDMDYLLRSQYTLDKLSWTQVSELTKKGLANKLWNVGDIKTFKLNYEDPDTHNMTYIEVPAMIIGFNQDGPNTITWMTQQSIINYGPVLTQKFYTELGTTANDGYNMGVDGTSYNPTALWLWLNNINAGAISIANALDSDMKSIILPVRKLSRMLYLVKDSNDVYHKYGYDSTTQKSCGYYKNYNVEFASFNEPQYNVPQEQFDRYGTYSAMGGDMFWLPTACELGIGYASSNNGHIVDEAERSAYFNAIDENSNYYEPSVSKYGCLRINPTGQRTDCDIYDISEFTYEYFTLPGTRQYIDCEYMFCRNFYALRSDDVTDPLIDFTTENIADIYTKYATVDRAYYLTAQAYYSEYPTNRRMVHIDRDIAHTTSGVGGIPTGFCFVTY